ncbi:MAG: pyridoxine 5'-phosphate synthase, partial [Desulfobacterales bacterium]|nr:pyridoxine 5'-phosphate synthase [Desulfobacterales bacterium]
QISLRLKQLEAGLRAGQNAGMVVHAGHGLTYRNVGPIAAIEGFSDFNIGHGIISRSIFVGIRQATKEMVELISN